MRDHLFIDPAFCCLFNCRELKLFGSPSDCNRIISMSILTQHLQQSIHLLYSTYS